MTSSTASAPRREAAAAGAEVHIAGPAGLIADLGAAFAGIDGLLLLVTLSAVLVILILVYRAIALPFVVLFTSVSALAWPAAWSTCWPRTTSSR